MANFAISNIAISNNRLVIGDTVTIGFTIKNTMGSSYTLKKATFWLRAKTTNNPVIAQLAYDEPVSIANGNSKKFSYTVTIEETTLVSLTALQSALNASTAVRALPLTIDGSGQYVVSGSSTQYGIEIDFDIPDAYIMRSRCLPTIQVFGLERASGGVPNDEGINVLTTLKLAMADTSEYSNMDLRLYYAQDADATTSSASMNLSGSISTLLSGVIASTTLITRTFSNGSDWDFMLVFGDAYESVAVHTSLFRAFANMHLSGASTGGVCFGGFGTSTDGNPKTESYYPIYPYKGIKGVTDYSESSQRAYGTWIDGKPTYRRTVQVSVTAVGTDMVSAVIDSDLQSVAEIQGMFVRSSDGKQFPLSFYRSASAYIDCQVTDDKTVLLRSAWTGTAYATVFYTRASDASTYDAATLLDAAGYALEDANGYGLTVAADTATVQLSHTAAEIDQAVNRTDELYGAYASGSLKGEKGDKGDPGEPGPEGPAGYTPVRGTDYWTAADQSAIVNDVLAALPKYAGEVEDA